MRFNTRDYSLGEVIFNSVSHGAAAGLSIAGSVVLIIFCAIYADAWAVVSASVYGGSLIILYTMSTLYHAITNKSAKKVFNVLDRNSIYLLIAGTYTTFSLVTIRGALGWVIFGIVWAAAALGITLTSVNIDRFNKFSIICYLTMGWIILIAIVPLFQQLSTLSFMLLIAGNLLYTVGAIFYLTKDLKYFHSIWHLFIIVASILHYFSIFNALIKS